MTTLKNATTEELTAELARREAGAPKPPPKIEPIDWAPVEKIADDYRAFCAGADYHDDNDWKAYFYEGVLRAVYGDAFFAWKRAVHR